MNSSGTGGPAAYRYLFGPVPSRRLGRSLGVDLVPSKTCSFDCLFCEAGLTSHATIERREFVPIRDVLAELDRWLASGGTAAYVTLSGAGEPTLHTRFGDVIGWTRAAGGVKSALLTNSSLLHVPAVRDAAARADLVKASLSAWDDASLHALNRPVPGLSFSQILEGLRAFRAVFDGTFWIEIMVVAGINDRPDAMQRLRPFVEELKPDRVHLNTVIRTPAYPGKARAVPDAELAALAACFDPPAETTTGVPPASCQASTMTEDELLAALARRPCTAADLAAVSGLTVPAVESILAPGLASGRVVADRRADGIYYRRVARE